MSSEDGSSPGASVATTEGGGGPSIGGNVEGGFSASNLKPDVTAASVDTTAGYAPLPEPGTITEESAFQGLEDMAAEPKTQESGGPDVTGSVVNGVDGPDAGPTPTESRDAHLPTTETNLPVQGGEGATSLPAEQAKQADAPAGQRPPDSGEVPPPPGYPGAEPNADLGTKPGTPAEQQANAGDASTGQAEQNGQQEVPDDIKAIQEKRANNKPLTKDEMTRLNDHNKEQNKDARRKELNDLLDKGQLNDPALQDELRALENGETGDSSTETADKQMEALKEGINKLDADMMQRLADGQMTPEDIVNLTEDMQRLQGEYDGIKNGFSQEDAREMIKNAISKGSKTKERKIAAAEKVQADLQKLMQIELQMLKLPQKGDKLQEAQAAAKKEVGAAHAASKRHKRGTREHMAEYQKEIAAMHKLNHINVQIVQLQSDAWILRAEQHNIESRVRLKIGAIGGLSGFLERTGGLLDVALTSGASLNVDNAKYASGTY